MSLAITNPPVLLWEKGQLGWLASWRVWQGPYTYPNSSLQVVSTELGLNPSVLRANPPRVTFELIRNQPIPGHRSDMDNNKG